MWKLGRLFVFALSVALARPVTADGPVFAMDLGTVAPPGSPWAAQLERYKSEIEAATQQRVQVRLRLGQANERSTIRRVQMGSMQAYAGSVAGMTSIVREVNVIGAPFLFPTTDVADGALDDPGVVSQVRRILDHRGLVFGFWSEAGYRSYFSRQRIRKPSDMQGLRFRSQEALVHLEIYDAFGATPVPIDVGNLLTSVQMGVVDGFDNAPLFAVAGRLHQSLGEGERHLFLSRHSYQPALLVYSKKWFDGLPTDIRRILTQIDPAFVAWGRQQVRRMEAVVLKNLAKYGYEIYEPSVDELAPFKRKQRRVPDRVAKEIGADAVKLLQVIRDSR